MNTFLRNFLFAGCLFGGALSTSAQVDVIDYKRLHISVKKNGQQNYERMKLEGQAALDFDIPKYINENIDEFEIRIIGTFISADEKIKVDFNSADLAEGEDCRQFCQEVVDIEQLPLLGVSMEQTHDFEGSLIKRIVENSAAEDAGLQAGDVITFVSVMPIRSDCDLIIAIKNHEVGEEVNIEYIRDDKTYQKNAVLGYQLRKTVSWVPCCDNPVELGTDLELTLNASMAGLKLFPNPSEGVSQLKYQATELGALNILVTDLAGREIYRNEINDFEGTYSEVLDLTGESAGIYFINVIQGEQVHTEKLIIQKK